MTTSAHQESLRGPARAGSAVRVGGPERISNTELWIRRIVARTIDLIPVALLFLALWISNSDVLETRSGACDPAPAPNCNVVSQSDRLDEAGNTIIEFTMLDGRVIDSDHTTIQVGNTVYIADPPDASTYLVTLAFVLLVFVVIQGVSGWTPGKLLTGIRLADGARRSAGVSRALVRWALPDGLIGMIGVIAAVIGGPWPLRLLAVFVPLGLFRFLGELVPSTLGPIGDDRLGMGVVARDDFIGGRPERDELDLRHAGDAAVPPATPMTAPTPAAPTHHDAGGHVGPAEPIASPAAGTIRTTAAFAAPEAHAELDRDRDASSAPFDPDATVEWRDEHNDRPEGDEIVPAVAEALPVAPSSDVPVIASVFDTLRSGGAIPLGPGHDEPSELTEPTTPVAETPAEADVAEADVAEADVAEADVAETAEVGELETPGHTEPATDTDTDLQGAADAASAPSMRLGPDTPAYPAPPTVEADIARTVDAEASDDAQTSPVEAAEQLAMDEALDADVEPDWADKPAADDEAELPATSDAEPVADVDPVDPVAEVAEVLDADPAPAAAEPPADATAATSASVSPYPPQWDAARRAYICWEPVSAQWLQWDDAAQTWGPITQ